MLSRPEQTGVFREDEEAKRPAGTCLPAGFHEFPASVVGEVMKERRRRERERLINLSTCGCVIQLYLWENTQFIEIREFGWGFLMLTS